MLAKMIAVLVVFVVCLRFVISRPASSYSDDPQEMCRLPEMRGHCRALIMRWKYDPETGKCYEFGFGGCDGNDDPQEMCRLPEMRGHCRALIMRWKYDPETGKCYEFGFGGCDGNGNNFPSRKACMDMCSGIH